MKNTFKKEDHTGKLKEALSNTAADAIDRKTIIPKKVANVATDAIIKE